MIKTMLLACGLLIAHASTQAQTTSEDTEIVYRDTVQLDLKGPDKIMFVGRSLRYLSRYDRADSLKTLFITDWSRAVAAQTVSPLSKNVHYFVHKSGKRRLKAESAEFSEPVLNVQEEIMRLDMDLPAHHFIIHDLETGSEIHMYIKDPAELSKELGAISFNQALSSLTPYKKDLRRNYKIMVSETENGSVKKTNAIRNPMGSLEIKPSIGLALIGNQFSPFIGADFMLTLPNKYGEPQTKFGVEYVGYAFTSMNKTEVLSVNEVHSFMAKFAVNANPDMPKPIWFGLEGGILKDPARTSLNNAFKMGVFLDMAGPFSYGFHWINTHDEKTIYGVTLKFPF